MPVKSYHLFYGLVTAMDYLKRRYTVVHLKWISCKQCHMEIEVNTKAIKYCLKCTIDLRTKRYAEWIIQSIAWHESQKITNEYTLDNSYTNDAIQQGIAGLNLGALKGTKHEEVEKPVKQHYYSKDLDPISVEEERITNEINRRLRQVNKY